MIRFINLGFQLTLYGERSFAWYSTITDTFCEFNGEQVWETWEEFEFCYEREKDLPESWPLERFKGLFPKDWRK